MRRPTWFALLTVVALAAVLAACNESERAETPRPLVVIGVDGGEWSVIRALWDEGKLPHLKSIADRGTSADLESPYSVSPVIWTSIATGQKPEVHGITDFVVPTDHGDVPISSTLRKVPAIWNLLTLVGRRVSVLGWYATWPAEAVNGFMVTDHVMRDHLPDRAYPPERLAAIDGVLETVRSLSDEETHPFGVALSDRRSERDLLIERIAPSEASEDYDLLMVYYRSIDHLSHFYWKFWEPRHYGNPDPGELAEKSDWIPSGYQRFDRLVGEILQASPDANVLIVSDHGFHRGRETLRVFFDMDRLLHHLGYLEWDEDGIDMERSKAFTHRSTKPNPNKLIRLALESREQGGRFTSNEQVALLERLRSDLAAVRYESGEPVLRVATPREHVDAELRARVLRKDLTSRVLLNGKAFDDVVLLVESVSGIHKPGTPGILLAAGPDIDPDAQLDGISIFDITPTLLYGLGLPVAEDFSGRAWTALFTEKFQRAHPLQTIDSWKMAREGELRESEADAEIIEELKALGYLQ